MWANRYTPGGGFGADPTTGSIGFTNGQAAGSATPLIWGQAQYLRLVLDLKAGAVLDQPRIVRQRYLAAGPPVRVPLTIASPGAGTTATAPQLVVTGLTTPGARVNVTAGAPASGANRTAIVTTVADAQGTYSTTKTIRAAHGKTVVRAAISATGATGWAQRTLKP